MYCKCMRLQKIQGSDMKLGGFDLSILTNLTTGAAPDDDPRLVTRGNGAARILTVAKHRGGHKNSTVPNHKKIDTKKKKASERVLFCVKKQHKIQIQKRNKKSQCNHKLAIEVVTTGGYNVTTDGYRVKT